MAKDVGAPSLRQTPTKYAPSAQAAREMSRCSKCHTWDDETWKATLKLCVRSQQVPYQRDLVLQFRVRRRGLRYSALQQAGERTAYPCKALLPQPSTSKMKSAIAIPLHMPRHASSRHVTPVRASPRRASPRRWSPRHVSPRRASPKRSSKRVVQRRDSPRLVSPRPELPRRVSLRQPPKSKKRARSSSSSPGRPVGKSSHRRHHTYDAWLFNTRQARCLSVSIREGRDRVVLRSPSPPVGPPRAGHTPTRRKPSLVERPIPDEEQGEDQGKQPTGQDPLDPALQRAAAQAAQGFPSAKETIAEQDPGAELRKSTTLFIAALGVDRERREGRD